MSEHIILWEQKSSCLREALWLLDDQTKTRPVFKITQDWGEDGKETVHFFLYELEEIVEAARAYVEALDD